MVKLMPKLFVSLLFVLISSIATANSVYADQNLPEYSRIYDEQRDPFKDAAAAIKLAQRTDRNVLIEIGGTWCTWCHKMDAFLEANPEVATALHDNFVVLKVSVSDANENEAFMKALPPVLGYPHMYVSTAKGKMLLSKDTAELQQDGKYSVENWLSFIDQWQPKATKALLELQAKN